MYDKSLENTRQFVLPFLPSQASLFPFSTSIASYLLLYRTVCNFFRMPGYFIRESFAQVVLTP